MMAITCGNVADERPGAGSWEMHEDANVTRADAKHALGRQLNFAAKSARSYLDQHLAAAGASFPVWTALFALKTEGPLIQRELAGLLNVEGPTLTRHLARMEAGGLIDRHRMSADRRAAIVRLTDAGEAMYARLSGIVAASGDIVLGGFTPGEMEEFLRYLTRVIDNVGVARPSRRHTGLSHRAGGRPRAAPDPGTRRTWRT
jgi:MarR family transcriptional regulator, transcriptional regulator for hemolysin